MVLSNHHLQVGPGQWYMEGEGDYRSEEVNYLKPWQ